MSIFYRVILSAILAAASTAVIHKITSAAETGISIDPVVFTIIFISIFIAAIISPLLNASENSHKQDLDKAQSKKSKPKKTKAAEGREQGEVKWFNVSKGYGFVTRSTGEDIFVHFRSIRGEGRRVLRDGQAVEFAVVDGDKGPQAEDVEAL
jgi:CspA family cold shock protein